MCQVLDKLVKQGWIIQIPVDMYHLTFSGLIAGVGGGSASFRYGFIHETILEMDVLTANGEVITCDRDRNSELFYAIPNSLGTMGYITRMKLQIRPAAPYVKVSYLRYTEPQKYFEDLDKYCKNEDILHQGFVAEVEKLEKKELKNFIKDQKNINLVCLSGATDPRNIGSIIRSAVAFNIDGIIVKERSFPSKSKLMYKSASGGAEHIKIFKVANINTTLKFLKTKEFWVSAFDINAKKDFTNHDWEGKNILLFGSEGFGIKDKTLVSITFELAAPFDLAGLMLPKRVIIGGACPWKYTGADQSRALTDIEGGCNWAQDSKLYVNGSSTAYYPYLNKKMYFISQNYMVYLNVYYKLVRKLHICGTAI